MRPALLEHARRVTRAPDWPYVAAALLGMAAVAEVSFRRPEPGRNASVALVLALAATAPVVLYRVQPLAAALVSATATAFGAAMGGRPPLGAAVAGAATAYVVVRGAVRNARAAALRRKASERAWNDSLSAHAARGERARIARELHDVVAHHISMIAVQAEAARLTTTDLPPDGARRLLAIGDTARTALTEMRRLLGVLREDASGEPTRRPQPGLQQLNDLLDEARGLSPASARLIVRGQVAELDPGVELTAYRIVQEALTNARRHAPGAAVDVDLHYRPDALHVRVRDNGPGPRPGAAGTGHGLLGMSERAAMVNGTLHAGPAPFGGFLVDAVLPRGGDR